MGYAVYEDRSARNLGIERWAGYGVPAICDMPECYVEIDRGMGYRCEEYTVYNLNLDTGEETETEHQGCELHFCGEHLDHATHGDGVAPKPDTYKWTAHMLTDDSWQRWRDENAETVLALNEVLAGKLG